MLAAGTSPSNKAMTRTDLANAIIPHLIAALPDPFAPDNARAKKAIDAASKWADLVHAEASNAKNLVMFTVG